MQNEKILIEGKFLRSWALPWILLGLGIFIFVVGGRQYDTNDGLADVLSILGLLLFAIALYLVVLFFGMKNSQIVVTDKRVYGKARFGKRVDLPLDSVSAVGTGFFKTVAVATSSGRIKFMLLENLDDVYETLNDLLLNRQNGAHKSTSDTSDTAEELLKFKELLASGIITQEEFDAKKKQLLGL